jgi:hypothetical protein
MILLSSEIIKLKMFALGTAWQVSKKYEGTPPPGPALTLGIPVN